MSAQCTFNVSDEEDLDQYKKGGYHYVEIGDIFVNRFIVKKKIGWGQSSTVWLCQDIENQNYVAMKIQKSALYYSEAAEAEIDMLEKVTEMTSIFSRNSYIVSLIDTFIHRGPNGRHVCMVFEILGISLLEVIKIYDYKGIPLSVAKSFIRQIASGLDFLHRTCQIIHTDLKPENILLELTPVQKTELFAVGEIKTQIQRRVPKIEDVPKPLTKIFSKNNNKIKQENQTKINKLCKFNNDKKNIDNQAYFSPQTKLKIVDLGNSVYTSDLCNKEIQTRHYRSPEVILGFNYSTSVDIWSLGCISFEIVTGELLFQPNKGEGYTTDDDHLAQIWEALGFFPTDWAAESRKYWMYFIKDKLKKISDLQIYCIKDILIDRYKFTIPDAEKFSEFLLCLLQVIPEHRITAEECLKHPWLN